MTAPAPIPAAAVTPAAPLNEVSRLAQLALVLIGAAVVALSVRLWPDWRSNPDLSHGMFMPLIFGLLVHEARQRPIRFLANGPGIGAGVALLLVLTLAALLAAGLYAASVDWSHPLVNGSLTVALVCLLGAVALVYSSDRVRLVGCNWTAATAVGLWFLCTPLPPGTYTRLTLTLQMWVTEWVLQALHVLGIAAVRHGNIIELANTTVGVEEACSGIRSLISCVFAGFFFSATLVRRPWGRALIISLTVPLALGMNFLRSLTLTLLSNGGVDISGAWHDLTGFAVLGVTAALLAGLALVLERGGPGPAVVPVWRDTPRAPKAWFAAIIGTLGIATVLVIISIANTRPSPRQDVPPPDLAALLPDAVPGWQVSTTDNLYEFSETLRTSHLAQRIYRRIERDGSPTEVILYTAYWPAGQVPVSLVASHTPDACWPGSGWTAQPAPSTREELHVAGRDLAAAEYRIFAFERFRQHVWFWHIYDGRPLVYRDPYSPLELLRMAWTYGFRRHGDQLFVRVSSNKPWAELARDPLLTEFFRRTQAVGL